MGSRSNGSDGPSLVLRRRYAGTIRRTERDRLATRRKGAVPELDTRRIATAALAVVDKHGLAGFTMRAVAKVLRVTPMALYHHVRDKTALATLVVDLVMRERALPAPTDDWQDDLWEMALWTRETMLAHPAVGHLRRQHRVWTPSMLAMTERWLSIWQRSGLTRPQAVRAAMTSSVAIAGVAEEETEFRNVDPPDPSLLASLPNLRTVLTAKHDPAAEFELVVRSLIEGLHARLRRDAGGQRRKRGRAAKRAPRPT